MTRGEAIDRIIRGREYDLYLNARRRDPSIDPQNFFQSDFLKNHRCGWRRDLGYLPSSVLGQVVSLEVFNNKHLICVRSGDDPEAVFGIYCPVALDRTLSN